METESQRALEHLFEQGAEVGLRLEHIAVGNLDRDLELDAVFVDDERDLADLHALDAAEALLDEVADDAEGCLAGAALLAAERDFLHRVTAEEQHGERAARQQRIKDTHGDDESSDKAVVEILLGDSAECRDNEYDYEHKCNRHACRCENLLDVLLHVASLHCPLGIFRRNGLPAGCLRRAAVSDRVLFFHIIYTMESD